MVFPLFAEAQLDPVKRQLIQLGYNAALEGHAPQSVYAFYYQNEPNFLNTNLALRLAIAPTYLDSELGIRSVLGENTHLGIGVAGGGFADNYREIRRGTYYQSESFIGYGGEFSSSLYHLFNPGHQIPLYGIVKGIFHYSLYDRDDNTANNFALPSDHGTFSVRTGARLGGKEPVLYPSLAMELSVWYQGDFRTEHESYGFNGDRVLGSDSHLFWSQALLAYTLPHSNSFYIGMTAGSSLDTDRFSAYRLGALLPLVSEFPLSLPGYYYQEISAKSFGLLGGNYMMPLDKKQRWNANVAASTAVVDYLPGLEQSGNWHTGVGAGILYKTPTWKIMVGYGYGFGAIRDGRKGAQSIGVLMQLDWGEAKEMLLNPDEPGRWRGLQQILGIIGE